MMPNEEERARLLAANVGRLLAAHGTARMPEPGRGRVLEALLGECRTPRPRWRTIAARWWIPAAAAAAALALLLVAPWAGRRAGDVAWSDVARRIAAVHAVSAWTTAVSGRYARVHEIRTEHAARLEWYADGVGDASPDFISIVREEPGREVHIHIEPAARRASREVNERGGTLEARPAPIPSEAAAPGRMLDDLKAIVERPARRLAPRTIAGREVLGFEGRIDSPAGERAPVVVRVWADAERHDIVEVEFEAHGERARFTDIEWNPAIAPEAFDLPRGEGWTIERSTELAYGFTRTALRPGIPLRVGVAGEAPVLTEADVAAVKTGRAWTSDRAPGSQVQVIATIRPESRARWASFLESHVRRRIRVTLDGRTIQEPVLMGGLPADRLTLDVTPLGMDLEAFEERYLVP